MRLTAFDIYQYNLPFKEPLNFNGQILKSREGIILHLRSDGVESFGETAPLPGFSSESLAIVLKQLSDLKRNLIKQDIPDHLEKLNGAFQAWLKPFRLSPSVRFGFEMGILNLLAQARARSLHRLLSKQCHEKIRINGLLSGSKEKIIREGKRMIEEGFTDIKLKTNENVEDSITKVKALNEVIEGKAVLHIDANRSWTLNDAVYFSNEVGLAAVYYIEEPFKEVRQIPDFFMKTTIPVALDESLRTLGVENASHLDGVDFLILKPTLLGGIEKTWEIIQEAKKKALETIISSSFESSIGIWTLAHLAGCGARDNHAGIDTLKAFSEELITTPPVIERGKIDISKNTITSDSVRFDLLKKIDV